MTEDASPRGLDTLFFRNRHLLWLSIIVILVGGASAITSLPRMEDPRIVNRYPLVITTEPAAFWTLVVGVPLCLGVGFCQMKGIPAGFEWPIFLYVSFGLFVVCVLFMVIVSLCTHPTAFERPLPTLREVSGGEQSSRRMWLLWGVLAVIMLALYVAFN